MNASKGQIQKTQKGKACLQRPLYKGGLLLRDDDLSLAVEYTRELNRMLLRSLVGCGVVCGLRVDVAEKCNTVVVGVAKGMAIDCRGNAIHVCDNVEIRQPIDCGDETTRDCLWVLVRWAESCCAPRTVQCAGEDDETASATACTRANDLYEIKLTDEEPKCACGCQPRSAHRKQDECQCADPRDPCFEAIYQRGECGCDCGDCDDCDCDWVVLAKVCWDTDDLEWVANHGYRRFVHPLYMADPLTRPAPLSMPQEQTKVTVKRSSKVAKPNR